MQYRLCLALFLLATAVPAEESAKSVYKYAKRLKGDQKVEYAAEKAAQFDGKATGLDLMYVGFLWRYAGELEKADRTFEAFLGSGAGVKNRPLVMIERIRIQMDLGAWTKVTPIAEQFFAQYPSHKYQAQMRFLWGRALRVTGQTEEALKQFSVSARTGYVHAQPEVVDCLLQLGKYDEAMAAARKKENSSYSKVVLAAAANFGKPLPKVQFGFMTLKDLAVAELRDKPTVFAFWSTKARRSNEGIHKATNGWVAKYKDAIHAVGPTIYQQFDPVTMRTVDDMQEKDEQDILERWSGQYGVKYPLALVTSNKLHEFCGIDAERPTLPAFAVTDKKGNLRYLRIGGSAWALEGVGAMLARLTKE